MMSEHERNGDSRRAESRDGRADDPAYLSANRLFPVFVDLLRRKTEGSVDCS
jgi:hypothetical protein